VRGETTRYRQDEATALQEMLAAQQQQQQQQKQEAAVLSFGRKARSYSQKQRRGIRASARWRCNAGVREASTAV